MTDKIGPRLPLILGPTIVGFGFLVTSFTGSGAGPQSYWTTYFPGIVLFGIGMGTTVAPLTTTVMSSVERELSGTASGINNAVSRVAGVLFLAILGAVALFSFGSKVAGAAAGLGLSPVQLDALAGAVSNLGNTSVPKVITGEAAVQLSRIIDQSFVETFRIIMYACTAFAWISAAFAGFLLRKKVMNR